MCSAYFIRSSCHGRMPSRAFRDRPPGPRPRPRTGEARPAADGRRWPRMDDYLEVNRLNWDERATGARRQRGVRVRPVRHRPRAPQRRRALRPAAARRRDRADRHPPAVPHRHRHPLAGPARRPDDRAGPVAGVAGAGPAARGRRRAPTSTTSRPTPTRRRRRSAGARFDLVYTGIGALCWLPDIDRWAGVVDDLLEPGGRLFVREGHPMMWAIDEPVADAAAARLPVLRDARAVRPRGAGHLRRDRRTSSSTPRQLSWNHGHRRDRDRPAGARASRSPGSSSTAACPGRRCRGGWCATATSASGAWSTSRSGCRSRTRCRRASRAARAGTRRSGLGAARQPGEEALVVDDHALDGAATDDRTPGIRRLDLEPDPPPVDGRHQRPPR